MMIEKRERETGRIFRVCRAIYVSKLRTARHQFPYLARREGEIATVHT